MPPDEAPGSRPDGCRLGLVLGLLVLPQYVALGAPSVALPEIGRALGVPFGATAWVLAAWSLTSALAMPIAGGLVARWSPFRVLGAGVVALAAGSALAGAGPALPVVVAGRLVGGAGAGATVIAVFALATTVPRPERTRALGVIAAVSATASACGTLLGGAVTEWLGWRAVLAVPVLALPALLAVLPHKRTFTRIGEGGADRSAGRFDVLGAAMLSVVAASLMALLQAHSVGLSAEVTVVVAVAGALGAVGLWWRVRRTPHGFVPRRVIGARGFLSAGLVGATVFAGYYGVLFVAPSLIERTTGGGALAAGALLLPAAACSVVAGRLVGVTTGRVAEWQVLAGLAALTAAGVVVVAVFDGPVPVVVGTALTVCGFAGGQAVLVGLAPELVAAHDRDTAQGLLNFMVFLGGGVGPATVAGLSGAVGAPVVLAVLAVLPLGGLVLSTTRRPGPVSDPMTSR
ncbi:MFS transporter [Lentzea sp.]|uniref:MFS transporter n=1 Tax=Lentzea sp. TaxID=56099 RepID=UPI002ED2C743